MSETAFADPHALLRLAEVRRLSGLSKSTIYAEIKRGRFPEPIRVTPSSVRWKRGDIIAWQQARARESRS